MCFSSKESGSIGAKESFARVGVIDAQYDTPADKLELAGKTSTRRRRKVCRTIRSQRSRTVLVMQPVEKT